MAFQIKSFSGIVAGMINFMRASQSQVTDFNVGSVARTLIEAPAIEIDELYQQMFIGLREAIPVSVYNSFGFDAVPAEAASGLVRFSAASAPASDVLIPAGTSVRQPNGKLEYATTVDGHLLAGNTYVDLMVYCKTAGAATNVLANTLTEIVSSVSGVDAVTNASPLTTGRDAETDIERKIRFQGYISTLSRGTNAAIIYGAKLASLKDSFGNVIENVSFVVTREPYLTDITQPVGKVNCYIHNGGGGTSGSLVAEVQSVIDGYYDSAGAPVPGWKAAGVVVTVIAASEVPVNVTATLTIDKYSVANTVRAACVAAVGDLLRSLDIGIGVSESEIIAAMMKVPGVTKTIMTTPSASVTAAYNQKIVPGTITMN